VVPPTAENAEAAQACRGGLECSSYTWQVRLPGDLRMLAGEARHAVVAIIKTIIDAIRDRLGY
jgi:hypothetical protein